MFSVWNDIKKKSEEEDIQTLPVFGVSIQPETSPLDDEKSENSVNDTPDLKPTAKSDTSEEED